MIVDTVYYLQADRAVKKQGRNTTHNREAGKRLSACGRAFRSRPGIHREGPSRPVFYGISKNGLVSIFIFMHGAGENRSSLPVIVPALQSTPSSSTLEFVPQKSRTHVDEISRLHPQLLCQILLQPRGRIHIIQGLHDPIVSHCFGRRVEAFFLGRAASQGFFLDRGSLAGLRRGVDGFLFCFAILIRVDMSNKSDGAIGSIRPGESWMKDG